MECIYWFKQQQQNIYIYTKYFLTFNYINLLNSITTKVRRRSNDQRMYTLLLALTFLNIDLFSVLYFSDILIKNYA